MSVGFRLIDWIFRRFGQPISEESWVRVVNRGSEENATLSRNPQQV